MDKLKNALKSCFSNGPKTIFILLLILIGITSIIDAAEKTVIVSIDGKETKINTYKNTFQDVLKENNIVLGPKDKTIPSLDTVLKKNDRIDIKKAVNIIVTVDGKNLEIQTAEDTVDKMFKAEGINIDNNDKVMPGKDIPIQEGLKLTVTRVESKIIEETQPIQFSTKLTNDTKLEKGKRKVLQEGQTGEKVIATNVVYEDGNEVSRTVINETVTKAPVAKVIAVGTYVAPKVTKLVASRGGSGLSTIASISNTQIKTSFTVRSTAYTADYKSTGKRPGDPGFGRTATGTRARRDISGYSTVAVDPRVIPYGTKMYIEGYGYAIAEDTGGAIKGNKIDVFFNSNAECMQWGVRTVTVHILK
ncbi:3D domain-containing protein [Clostridium sp. SYSU_GA19001]|uniref:3D domain-containing protein n=1 Tax=Clostridium caldaquaticum TaxID=2940653 RepID=UPI0020779220|nr:3D domain-containing protein [Clostridium caldaquaticum]MCM8710716.1 3D domain-containing protein [Clostridium caldaquaticum]